MKTIITTISLVILLQFSFTTTVNAVDVRQTCIEGLAENSDLIFSQSEYNTLLNDCIKKFSKYEAPPKKWEEDPKYGKRRSVLKVIGIIILGLIVISFIPSIGRAISSRKPYKPSQAEIKAEEERKAKYKKDKEKLQKQLKMEALDRENKFSKLTGKDFKASKKLMLSMHPIDIKRDSDGNVIKYPTSQSDNSHMLSMYFLRHTLKYKKPDLVTLANYYKVKYESKDSLKTIQEKIYDVLERESSSGRFKTCLRHVLVWSFISMQLYVEQQIKEGKVKELDDNIIRTFEQAAHQDTKKVFHQDNGLVGLKN
jgi:hypothetical protein